MSLATNITGSVSGNVAEVDANNQVKVTLTNSTALAGYNVPIYEVDSGTVVSPATRRAPHISRNSRQSVGLDTGIFDYFFGAGAQDTGIWKYTFTTMTASQSGGFLLLNANSTGTTTTGTSLTTWRSFDLEGHSGLRTKAVCIIPTALQANQVIEFGLFVPTVTTAPADGVYFRITSAGIIGVVNYNGTETPTGVFLASPVLSSASDYWIETGVRGCEFWIDGVLYGTVSVPAGNAQPFITGALPLTFQQRNSGAVSGTQCQFKVGRCHVTYIDMQIAMPYSHQQCAEGLTIQQGIAGGTMGTSELFSNNLASGAGAVMTNTTAALGTGLGGQFACQPTLAVGTDGIVCSYANPAGSVSQRPRVLMITGVKIMSVVTTILSNTAATTFIYSLAFGHTALSMATAEAASFTGSPTTKAPRRVVLGVESFVTNAAVGTVGSAEGIYTPFNSPIPVNPGEFVAITAKNISQVTVSGVIQFLVTFDGYWI